MGSATGFELYRASRLTREEVEQLAPRRFATEHNRVAPVDAIRMKNVLGDIQTDYDNVQHGPLSQRCFNTSLWHIDAVGGRPPHQLSGSSLSTSNGGK